MKPRTRRFADVALIELVRPDPYWPDPYSTEMAFQALRWLIASASGDAFVEEHRWHTSCAVGLMGGAGAQNGACRAIRSRADLRERFIQALLARPAWHPEVARWRAAKGIHIDAVVRMKFRHYKPYYPPAHLPWRSEADITESLDSLLEKSIGTRLAVALNPVHDDARIIHDIGIIVGARYFDFLLHYGFVDPRVDPCDSEWTESLARTIGDEPFLDTLARAVARFGELTTPRETPEAQAAA